MTKILVAGFMHETNTFSRLPTDLEAYRARSFLLGEEVAGMRGTRTEIAGFLEVCERRGWSAVHPVFANATPSGPVTREAFEFVSGLIFEALEQEGPFDALLLNLHGAMVTDQEQDGEGCLLERLRERLGPDLPIAVTLDLHANVTRRMTALTNVMLSYRTYPHVDQFEIASEAAELIARTLAGEIAPRVHLARGALLDGVNHGRTTSPGPMTEILDRAAAATARPGILSVAINAGFPWADIEEAGPSAVITYDANEAAAEGEAEAIGEALVNFMWQTRHDTNLESLSVAEAMAAAKRGTGKGKPLVLADFADNPGGGGYGDSTGLLRGMIEAELENAAFGTVYDPETVARCAEAGVSARLGVSLGGKIDPSFGAPIETEAEVCALCDGRFVLTGPMMRGTTINLGRTAVLGIGGLEVVVASHRAQVFDEQYFRHAGIEPTEKSVLGVKSAQHFRAAFAPIARAILVVDEGGGLTSHDLKSLPFKNVRRPIYPLDLE